MTGRSVWLRCVGCGAETDLGPRFAGCPICAARGVSQALEVVYEYGRVRASNPLKRWRDLRDGLWRFRELLPLADGVEPLTLVEGGTPLLSLEGRGPGRVWLKDETRNPTGAFKDRFHAVSLSMARHLGYRKVVAASTGNHGTALAAYAASAGLEALVFCDPEAPEIQRQLMQLFGARVAVLAERSQYLEWLVRERGWYPSTCMSPLPVATPYGAEGYKTIAFEVFLQLGHMPSRMVVPVAGGDSIYGPWKGFLELRELGVDGVLPRMVAVQSTGCDPVVQGVRERRHEVPVCPDPRTVALSIGDATGGAVSLKAVYDSGGDAVAVSDAEILDAMRTLGRLGKAVEPASAATVAAVAAWQRRGEIGEDEDVVCVLTGAAAKWPAGLRQAGPHHELWDEDPAVCRAWIAGLDGGS